MDTCCIYSCPAPPLFSIWINHWQVFVSLLPIALIGIYPSHCIVPVPQPPPGTTEDHPIAKQQPRQPSDDQSKPLFAHYLNLYSLGQCPFM